VHLAKLILVLAESALETVPEALWGHPEVRRDARERGLSPSEVLLDRSYHHRAMKCLKDAYKRGRPDIVHFSLLNALETPLCEEGFLRVYVHTVQDLILEFDPGVRLPRNYMRFKGLMEQLFKVGRVPPEGKALVVLRKGSLADLRNELKPDMVIGFSSRGSLKPLHTITSGLSCLKSVMMVIGCFPHGEFKEENMNLFDSCYAIYPKSLNAWVVVARLIYEVEKSIGLS
jgi:rRNA small subunit pseudouridine methyltransferase Nep1